MSQEQPPPFSKSADKNKDVILEQLKLCLKLGDHVLEVASGTGQHAVHFAAALEEITWHPSDRDLDAYGLRSVLATKTLRNIAPAIELDIAQWTAPAGAFDAVYSANCLHVIPEGLVEKYIAGASQSLKDGGLMLLYGPFKYRGEFTTPSNEEFDGFLRNTYQAGGIRDFERINDLARENGLEFASDTAMPSNNQFLIWRKAADQ